MKEEWLMSGAVVPVDVETTAALVAEIRRLIDVVGGLALAQQEPAEPIENWYYLDEVLTLHQLGKWQGFDAAYAEMEIAATKRGTPYLILVCEYQVREWRAQLDRWLGNDGYTQKYKKRKGDL